jgi:hypothetical protein
MVMIQQIIPHARAKLKNWPMLICGCLLMRTGFQV